ncbi:hypothetical protein J8I26_04590 [Herbaspirillum sp. LeCh32-8]|uniref:hypothetical protein n=1 Tax=Herbaspirillum sp. LeCh32-8 TaxID=2821356 RepID=UPI001AE92428|nr:hypothetical protein [Herbaspirillum sp. LeCh32-8]MBP0597369.1 hypothetical protein [Herbaspirillum sp. LeCh32-8]
MAKQIRDTQHGSDQQAARQQEQYSEAPPEQQDGRSSLATSLPEEEADRLLQGEARIEGEDAELEEVTQLRRREERHRPESLEEEDIGLQHVSGIDEEEVGKELNITGDEDNDEDDSGNPAGPQMQP